MSIGETKELCKESKYPISDQEYRRGISWSSALRGFMSFPEEHDNEEDTSLQQSLEQWTRKVGYPITYDGKWTSIWRVSEEFCIDEIPYAPESECRWEYGHERVRYIEYSILVLPCVEKYREYHSERATMEAHTTLPKGEYFE